MIGKIIVGLTLVVALVYSNSSDTGPRPDDRCPGGVTNPPHLLPDLNDCTRFFMCVNRDAFPVNCPDGQHFSVELNRCDWPE